MSSEVKKKLLAVGFAISMLYAMFFALPLYISSSVLSQYFSSSGVSLLYSASAVAAFVTSLLLARYIKKIHNYNFTLFFLFLSFASTVSLGYFDNKLIMIIAFIFNFLGTASLYTLISLFIEEFTDKSIEGTTRGIFLTVMNAGILISPLIAGQLMSSYGYKYVFFLSAIMLIPIAYLIRHYYYNIKDPIYKNVNIFVAVKQIIRNKNVFSIVLASFMLESFFAMMAIYAPLLLTSQTSITLGQYVGIIIPFALIPFVLLPYELGYLADKKWGEKELLIAGFIIIIACSVLFPFITTSNILFVAAFLFISRIGAAMVETMSHTYFYKKVNIEKVSVIALFNSTRTLAYVAGPLVGGVILYFTDDLMYIFMVYALLAATALILRLSRIQDTL